MTAIRVILAALLLASSVCFGSTELYDADALRAHFGLDLYPPNAELRNLRIAVLDSGFSGYQKDAGLLPKSAELIEKYDAQDSGNSFEATPHGLYMAQTIWALTGKDAAGPKFYLLNANGVTNLRRAVAFSVEHKIDIILYSQNWEYGGNFDGKGFINQIVNEATAKGIIWINAAGNYGGRVYNGAIPEPSRCLKIKNTYDRNQVTITLSWNDFKDSEDYQTTKDLDFTLLDAANKIVARGDRGQVMAPTGDTRRPSLHARERVTATLERGDYCLNIKKVSANFTSADEIRVSVMTENKPEDSLEFVDHTQNGEIMVPGDNATVITVGNAARASATGPTVDGRTKPEIVLDATEARFTDGFISSGTSNSAAFFAAITAVLKANKPALDRDGLLKIAAATTAQIRHGNLQLVDKLLLWNLLRDTGLKTKDAVGISVEKDRRILYLTKNPLELGSLFETQALPHLDHGVRPNQLRFFITGSQDTYGRTGVQAQVVPNWKKGEPAPLFLLEHETGGACRWIEVRKAPAQSFDGALGRANWRTPLPDEL